MFKECAGTWEQCSSVQWVIAVIPCWMGMAVQPTRVGEAHSVLAVAPLSCSGSGYPVRASVGTCPSAAVNWGTFMSHGLVCDTVSTEVNGGE